MWYGPRPLLGQANTPRRRLLPYAALLIAILAAPAVSGASRSSATAHQASLAGKTRSAVLGLYALDQQLANAQARLAALEHRQSTLQAERASLTHGLAVARHSTAVAQRDLAQQVRARYEQGTVEPIEVVLGARSLDEAMSSIDALDAAATANRSLIDELEGARTQLVAARRALAERSSALEAARAQARATVDSLTRARAARAAYIATLQDEQRLSAQRVAEVTSAAQAAVVAPQRTEAALPTVAGGTTLTVSATAYSLPGYTSSGLPVGWGVVAVDPSLIPLGTHMTIPGYGEAVAADTGTAIIGARIDLWFPTLAQAQAWGRRTVTITIH